MNHLTHERLKELLEYNPDNGVFKWKITRKQIKKNTVAGTKHSLGYWSISVDNKIYLAHRLAWFYSYAQWPKNVIDHINKNKQDNRLTNLRSVTQKENGKNIDLKKSNISGANGVRHRKDCLKNPWQARVMHDRKEINLGFYPTFKEALEARKDWENNFWENL